MANRRQVFDLGDAVAILQPDGDGLASVCLIEPGGGSAEPQEIWVFGKVNMRAFGELALAAQRFVEDIPQIQALAAPESVPKVLEPPIDTPGEGM